MTPDPAVRHRGTLRCGHRVYPCAIGKAGVTSAKREGDHMTPLGSYALRRLWYRPDMFAPAPETGLPLRPIAQSDGWCDDPASGQYNRSVNLPFSGSHEKLWRDDHVYDLVVEIGYNDDPPVSGLGSAIFLHLARPDWSGTEGCVALARDDLLEVLKAVGPTSRIHIG